MIGWDHIDFIPELLLPCVKRSSPQYEEGRLPQEDRPVDQPEIWDGKEWKKTEKVIFHLLYFLIIRIGVDFF